MGQKYFSAALDLANERKSCYPYPIISEWILFIGAFAQIFQQQLSTQVSLAVFCGRRKDDSLNYNVFGNEVKQEVEKLLGSEVRVELRRITKNNGIILEGLCILEKGSYVSPTIYLEDFYREYKDGMSLKEIAGRIYDIYEKRCRNIPFSLEYFLDFEKIKENIFCKLVNREMNQELLRDVPSVSFLDLSVVFICAVKNEEFGNGSVLIREEHRKHWKVSKELLYEYARENTFRLRPFELKSMEELIEDLVEPEERNLLKEIPMYVLSNRDRVFGAAGILYDRILSSAGARLEEDFYVLPSSVHEVILVPGHVAGSEKELHTMVHEVNHTQVEPEEVLSENVYHYDRKKHCLSIC